MIWHDSNCSLFYVVRSTKAISQFQAWWESRSDLMSDAARDLVASRLEIVKQMCIEVWIRRWNQNFSSKQLELVAISNCYVQDPNSIATILQDFLTMSFNRSTNSPAIDDSQEKKQKKGRILDEWVKKCEEKVVRKWEKLDDFWSWSEKMIVDSDFLLGLGLNTMP